MMIAARNSFLMGGGGPTPWQNPYVTNGLIAMWDGEWNAGGGVHDANATTWLDLSGNGNDLDITAGTWAADHFVCNGASGGKTGFIDGVLTLEAVAKITATNDYRFAIGLHTSGSNFDRYFGTNRTLINFYSNGPGVPLRVGVVESYGFDYVVGAIYKNGGPVAPAGNGTYYPKGQATGVVLGASAGGGYPFGGEIYAIRLYSRALTAAEVAANYAVDAARFGL